MKIRILDKDKHDSLMNSMLSNAGSDKPQIGIFWFDVKNVELFGVHKDDFDRYAKDKLGRVIYPKLHYQVWTKDKYKLQAKGLSTLQYKGRYCDVHRGRVNYENGEFLVYVGSWINELEPKLTPLIKAEFNLDDFDYVIDSHWELGHGFNGDKF